MIRVNLTDEARSELLRFRNHSDKRGSERALYVLMNDAGKSIPEIVKITQRNILTVRNSIKRYIKEGINGFKRKPASGRPSLRNTSLKPFISEILAKSPTEYGYFEKIWTIKMMLDCYQKRFGQSISHDTVQRALRELGYSYKRSRLSVSPNAPSKEEKVEQVRQLIDEINQALDDDNIEVIFVDETHVNNQPYISRGWSKKKSSDNAADTTETGRKNRIWRVEFKGDEILFQNSPQV